MPLLSVQFIHIIDCKRVSICDDSLPADC